MVNKVRPLAAVLLLWAFAYPLFADTPPEPLPNDPLPANAIYLPLREEGGRIQWILRELPEQRLALPGGETADLLAARVLREAFLLALEGPTLLEARRGLKGAFPPGTQLLESRVEGTRGGFFLSLPQDFLGTFTPEKAQDLADLCLGLSRLAPQITQHVLMVRDPASGRFETLDFFLPKPDPVPQKDSEMEAAPTPRATGQPPGGGQGQPTGFLTGKSVFVNPGHGWYYNTSTASWITQRTLGNYMIEDHSNAEAVLTYLTRYLWNAGAGVYPCRERDMGSQMALVNDGGAGYSETGSWSTVTNAGAYGGSYRRAAASATETATATFTPTVPADGEYEVYLWYYGTAENVTNAEVTVRHTGGSTTILLNQERDGATFKNLGRFFFRAGSNPATGSVVLSNRSNQAGGFIAADAVRFGGGIGAERPFGEPSASGKPRFEEAGPYYASFMGCATCTSSTVTAMPRFVTWERENWEDALYLSWHSNATGGAPTSRGTMSFAYASGGWDAGFDGIPGGLELRNAVHAEIVADLRAGYDAAWPDWGLHTNWYGEINPTYNSEMPSALFEMAFHDNATDAAHLRNPVFRQIVARAVYQGVVKYFATRDAASYTLLPESPTHFSARNDGTGKVLLAWNAPPSSSHAGLYGDPATGYRVYRSVDGRGFDNGVAVAGTTFTDTAIAPGQTVFYKVSATNAGGESFPTETLAARSGLGLAPVLIVSGFDRIDASLAVVTTDPQSGGTLHRGVVDQMNSYRYMVPFGKAVAAFGIAFDTCSDEAVVAGSVPLAPYRAVLWYCGEESSADVTLSATTRSLLQTYLDGGGNLFTSGSEIGWDLDYLANGASFYNGYLKADYAGDDAGTYATTPLAGGIFAGNAAFSFDDGTHGEYDCTYPDQLTPLGGAVACLAYSGGSGGTAALQFSGAFKVVTFGFPFETIVGEAARAETMADILAFFGLAPVDDTTAPADTGDSLRWVAGLGRWEWSAVTLDRLGSAESGIRYEVRRSASPLSGWSVVGTPSAPYFPDALTPPGGSCWYYLVTALDGVGNRSDAALDVIRDNPEATFVGTWSTNNVTAGHWGDDYRYITTGGTGANTATWSFPSGERGSYEVFVYYPSGGNRSTASRFTVSHAGGSTLKTVNQQLNGGAWVSLGSFWFEAGQNYTVTLDDAEPIGFVVLADAVRWKK